MAENERQRCDLQKQACRLKQKQKIFINSISNEFINHFTEIVPRIPNEVNEIIFKIFLGFKVTPIKILKVKFVNKIKKMMKDEKDMKSIFKEAEITNSFHNTNNKQNSLTLVAKIQNFRQDNSVNLEFPVNAVIEFITNSQDIYQKEEKIDYFLKEYDSVKY